MTYDSKPCPGIVQNIDANQCEVDVMHRIGDKRFYWPTPDPDIIWYHHTSFVTLIEPPKKVRKYNF